MVEYKLKYEGEKIDELLEAVDNGSVVTSNTDSVIERGNEKPVSSDAIHRALDNKVDKIAGQGLSEWSYTSEDRDAVATVKDGSIITNNTVSSLIKDEVKPISSGAMQKLWRDKGYTFEGVRIDGSGTYDVYIGGSVGSRYILSNNAKAEIPLDGTSVTFNGEATITASVSRYQDESTGSYRGTLTVSVSGGLPLYNTFFAESLTPIMDALIPHTVLRKKDVLADVIAGSTLPVQSHAIHTALTNKVDKVDGKGLSTNDYTTEDKRIVIEAKTALPSMQTALNEHSDTLVNHELRITENLNMVEISWSDLKNKRDDGDLIFGTLYRINDYVTTTTQENTRSAGHQFNVIVLALAPNTLSEEAYAIWASDDGYFESNNLSAWKIWYCLDNDTTRFAWADEVNGKGVIYRMIDEFGNDCPYDFKNIQFLRNIILNNSYPEISEDGIRTWVYTFCARAYHAGTDEWSELKDGSLESPYGHESDEQTSTFHHNVMMPYIKLYDDGEENFKKCGIAYLNNNVFFGWYEERYSSDAEYPYYNAHCCYNNTLGNDCYNNTFGYNCYNNTFGSRCYNNTFGYNCCNNTFGSRCYNNTFGYNCYYNTLGNDSFGNVLGCFCLSNHYGNYCYSNRLGDSCAGNILADGSTFNRLQEECCYNIFSNYCSYNNLGVSCSNNSFGSGCDSNDMFDSSSFNSFGNGCCSNIISKRGKFNRFGNGAIGNILGQFYKSITLGEDVCYVRFTDGGNGSDTSMVQNYQVANGLKGTAQKLIHVSVQRNLPYETTIARNTKGDVVLLCLVG